MMNLLRLLLPLTLFTLSANAEDGYRLWLRYDKIENTALLNSYSNQFQTLKIYGSSPTLSAAQTELLNGLGQLTGRTLRQTQQPEQGSLLLFTKNNLPQQLAAAQPDYAALGSDGFCIKTVVVNNRKLTLITANTDIGILYGTFHLLRLLQTWQPVQNLQVISVPAIQHRILNHWDNLNRTIERGYAGFSIWNWHTLPDYIDQRYIDYARANASIGINGTVLTNVNANALVLTHDYLLKVKALADAFRPYGLKVYLTAKFSAPVEIGGLKTADPLDTAVQHWWQRKADEIYNLIPDFGGFLVKANSEGQPGPQTYNRTHADGANMLADAVGAHGGIIMWRAFVYDVRVQKHDEDFDSFKTNKHLPDIAAADRFKQAYTEFTRFDGQFRKNVLVQVKNGPIDFQPREPFSPLFGAMSKTPLAMEFQLTMEYLGQGTHLVYQAPLFKEVLDADTYAAGKGSTIAKVIDGSLYHHTLSAIAGVSNIGSERNWTNHPFGQATWYAYGKLAWNPNANAVDIAREWVQQTFTHQPQAVQTITNMMMASREAVVNYMTPLGLHHIMSASGHWGPGPWVSNAGRADWNSVYYHRADSFGIGFNRTATGSNALAQYAPEVQAQWKDSNTCDEKYLLWFHHVSWQHRMHNGKTLWEELCTRYQQGVDTVRGMQASWNSLQTAIDPERFRQVQQLLAIQEKEARWWRNSCLLYFQTFSRMPLPAGVEPPDQTLDYYKSLRFLFVPGAGSN